MVLQSPSSCKLVWSNHKHVFQLQTHRNSPECFYVSKSLSLSVWRVFPQSKGRPLCSEVLKAPSAMVTGCPALSCVSACCASLWHTVPLLPAEHTQRHNRFAQGPVTCRLRPALSHCLWCGAPNRPCLAVVPPQGALRAEVTGLLGVSGGVKGFGWRLFLCVLTRRLRW